MWIVMLSVHNNHLLYHEILTKNETGSTLDSVFGFLLDAEFGQWKVFDHMIEKDFYVVVAGYNLNYMEITATDEKTEKQYFSESDKINCIFIKIN